MDSYNASVMLGDKELQIGTGLVAKQAHGATLVRYGDSVILVTATHSHSETNRDYFPLMVDFEEKMYAAGKIPGGFIKREGRSSDHSVVSARLVDRAIRPLFPKDYKYEVQVICLALSSDMENPLDVCALSGASVALGISEIPFAEPVAAVRVGRVDGEFVVNPTFQQIEDGDLDMVVAGTEDAIMMVEGESKLITESEFLAALDFARGQIDKIIPMQKEIIENMARPKMEYEKHVPDEELIKQVYEFAEARVAAALDGMEKKAREKEMSLITDEAVEKFATVDGEVDASKAGDVRNAVEDTEKRMMRKMIKEKGIRADGRKLDEIRPISCEVGLLPRPHGSALFTRGQTQVLSIVTLASRGESQRIDGISHDEKRPYYHQYNFPPFSVGEVRPMRGPSRRDIGHGTLAERALIAMQPSEDEFPYAVRVVSEVLESNGSSSMASVCGSSLSLLDAGVPIKHLVSGIAMGLIVDEEDNSYNILTDIQGLEDHDGDMDFKVAGTREGITAVQMDIKVKGIPKQIMQEAMEKAKAARLFILDKMEATISEPRKELSPYAPRFLTVQVDIEKIGTVIGPSGKTVRGIVDETGAQIDIEDDGRIFIYGKDSEAVEKAKTMIEALVEEVVIGKIYTGAVKRIVSFGAFVEILPGTDGLVHISQLAEGRIERVEDVVNIGDEVKVKVREVDDFGRVNLTMLLDSDTKPRHDGPPRGGNRRDDSRHSGSRNDRDRRKPPPRR